MSVEVLVRYQRWLCRWIYIANYLRSFVNINTR